MYYQYELTHFEGDMGHGVASDEVSTYLDLENITVTFWEKARYSIEVKF